MVYKVALRPAKITGNWNGSLSQNEMQTGVAMDMLMLARKRGGEEYLMNTSLGFEQMLSKVPRQ